MDMGSAKKLIKRIALAIFLLAVFAVCVKCMAFSPTIRSFNGGDVGPHIESRMEFKKYQSSMRTIENMLVTPQGPVQRRPGTYFVASANGSQGIVLAWSPGGAVADYPQLQNITESYVSNRIANIFDNIEVVDPQGTTAITNEAELLDIGVGVPLGGSYYLTTDIVVSGIKTEALIGPSGNYFSGTFDGRGYKITYVLDDGGQGVNNGLFHGLKDGALVQNLLIDATMTVARVSAILAGLKDNEETSPVNIKNVHTRGTITILNTWAQGTSGAKDEPQHISGFISLYQGGVGSELNVTDCTSNVAITWSASNSIVRNTAGFTSGNVQDYATFINCHSAGSITLNVTTYGATDTSGFISGPGDNSFFSKCSSNVTIVTNGGNIGGFAASADGTGSYSECFALGDVTSGDSFYTGGFVSDDPAAPTFTDCYAKGDVTCNHDSLNFGGGFVGSSEGTFANCYSIGLLTSTSFTGGFSGEDFSTTTNSFWDTETSGEATTDGDAVGKTTALMKTQATFEDAGWDFDTIWVMGSTAVPTNDTVDFSDNGNIRLIPFEISTDDSYVLEFGTSYLRFYREGA